MTTPRLGLSELVASQSQPHVPINASGRILDTLVGCAATSRTIYTPPGSPAEGDTYLIPFGSPSATGAWAGQEGTIAFYAGTAWEFITPTAGFLAWVVDERALYVYEAGSPSTWTQLIAA
jgi:hypothetical protein